MLAELRENYEIDSDDLIELPIIKEMHYELINESIKDQMDDPFENQVNFVEEYFETIKEQNDLNGENPDVKANIKADAFDFCQEVMGLIDQKFNLDIDMDTIGELSYSDLKALTYASYDFFVIHYKKNIKKFFVKYILNNIEDIYSVFSNQKGGNDVVTTSLRNKLTDERAVLILSNLKTVIEYICSLDINGLELFENFNPEKYEIYILMDAVENGYIGETFTSRFLAPMCNDYEDELFTNIYLSIESALYKKFLKNAGE